jgi:hypothetical protein
MPPEFECKELTLYFRYFPFVFGCIPKQGGVHHDVVFFFMWEFGSGKASLQRGMPGDTRSHA